MHKNLEVRLGLGLLAAIFTFAEPSHGIWPKKAPHACHAEYALLVPLRPEQISYKTYGNPKNETIVLIHGMDSSMVTFDNIKDELAKKYHVIVYDQRGHGNTAAVGINYSSQVMAHDLKVLLDHLKIKQATILGHSMGGRTAVKFAELYPELCKAIIVEDMEMHARAKDSPGMRVELYEESQRLKQQFANPQFANREALVEALTKLYDGNSREAESIATRRSRANEDGTYTLLFRPDVSVLYGTQGNVEDLLPSLGTIKAPVLFLRADPKRETAMEDDGAEKVKATLPTAQIEMIGKSTHAMHRSSPDQFVDLVDHFMTNKRILPEYEGKYEPGKEKLIMLKDQPISQQNATIHKAVSGQHPKVATEGTNYTPEVVKGRLLPRGSALITDSGQLKEFGITAVIHAATGSMGGGNGSPEAEPTLESIQWSVGNSLSLAQANNHKRVAIPFIGGAIFLDRIGTTPEKLAEAIISSALERRGKTELRFVLWDERERVMFQKVLESLPAFKSLPPGAVEVVRGSLTEFKDHGASAIVNAANMEVMFGAGLSGAIAKASGERDKIDDEAAAALDAFNNDVAVKLGVTPPGPRPPRPPPFSFGGLGGFGSEPGHSGYFPDRPGTGPQPGGRKGGGPPPGALGMPVPQKPKPKP